jgi:hypothetical protein
MPACAQIAFTLVKNGTNSGLIEGRLKPGVCGRLYQMHPYGQD